MFRSTTTSFSSYCTFLFCLFVLAVVIGSFVKVALFSLVRSIFILCILYCILITYHTIIQSNNSSIHSISSSFFPLFMHKLLFPTSLTQHSIRLTTTLKHNICINNSIKTLFLPQSQYYSNKYLDYTTSSSSSSSMSSLGAFLNLNLQGPKPTSNMPLNQLFTSSGSTWASADVQQYQNRYPGQQQILSARKNLDFYQNRIASQPRPSATIEQMHQNWFGDYQLLEDHHGYIQWSITQYKQTSK